MRAFLAIIKLTLQNALRSHIFQLLSAILALCVIAIPLSIRGDGTATGFIQVSLLYSLSSVSVILALSSIWVSCYIMTQDIDSYQLHMVLAKPISRLKVWFGKFTGVLLLHTVLLVISSIVIYGIIQLQFYRSDFSDAEKNRVENEVLVGRRVFKFTPPNIEQRSRELFEERLSKVELTGENITLDSLKEKNILAEMRRMAIAADAQVAPESMRQWTFENLPTDNKQPLYLRYRTYVGKVSSKDQRMTQGIWFIGSPVYNKDAEGKVINEDQYQFQYFQYPLETIRSGEFYEKVIDSERYQVVAKDGKTSIAYTNLDPEKQTQYFQPSDGPKILMKVTSFSANYARAILVVFLELVILTGIGCALAGFFTMPTAIFISIAYLFGGFFATFLKDGAVSDEIILKIFSRILLVILIPLQKFGVTDMLAKGELVEFSQISSLFFSYFVFKAVPIILIGLYMYKRREIGLVVRK